MIVSDSNKITAFEIKSCLRTGHTQKFVAAKRPQLSRIAWNRCLCHCET